MLGRRDLARSTPVRHVTCASRSASFQAPRDRAATIEIATRCGSIPRRYTGAPMRRPSRGYPGHVTCFVRDRNQAGWARTTRRQAAKEMWGRGRWGALSGSQRRANHSLKVPVDIKAQADSDLGTSSVRDPLDSKSAVVRVPPNHVSTKPSSTPRDHLTPPDRYLDSRDERRSLVPSCTELDPAFHSGAWTRIFVRYRSPVPASVFAPC